MSVRESILEANRAFYQAFESLDANRMGELWLRDQRIVCIHPGWRRLTGWGPIMNSWERIFKNVFEMKFELDDPQVMTSGDLAVVVVEENLTQRGYDGTNAHAGADDQCLRTRRRPVVDGFASRLARDGASGQRGTAVAIGFGRDG
jgi:ketosteroid isomerase-like protein